MLTLGLRCGGVVAPWEPVLGMAGAVSLPQPAAGQRGAWGNPSLGIGHPSGDGPRLGQGVALSVGGPVSGTHGRAERGWGQLETSPAAALLGQGWGAEVGSWAGGASGGLGRGSQASLPSGPRDKLGEHQGGSPSTSPGFELGVISNSGIAGWDR